MTELCRDEKNYIRRLMAWSKKPHHELCEVLKWHKKRGRGVQLYVDMLWNTKDSLIISITPDRNDRRSLSAPHWEQGQYHRRSSTYLIGEGWFYFGGMNPPKKMIGGAALKTKEERLAIETRWQRLTLYAYAVITKKLEDLGRHYPITLTKRFVFSGLDSCLEYRQFLNIESTFNHRSKYQHAYPNELRLAEALDVAPEDLRYVIKNHPNLSLTQLTRDLSKTFRLDKESDAGLALLVKDYRDNHPVERHRRDIEYTKVERVKDLFEKISQAGIKKEDPNWRFKVEPIIGIRVSTFKSLVQESMPEMLPYMGKDIKPKATVKTLISDSERKILDEIKKNVDLTKQGWVDKASKIIGTPPQKTRRWILRRDPDMLEHAHTRKTQTPTLTMG